MVRYVWGRVAATVLVVLGTAGSGTAAAYTAAPGVAASSFAMGFPNAEGRGPIGVAFDGAGRLYVSAGDLYRFGPEGGPADAAHRVNAGQIGGIVTGLAFGRGGALYAARWTSGTTGDVVQLDPRDGSAMRQVVSGLTCPTGLAVDPRSGDLFVSSVWCADQVVRISGGVPTPYATGVHADGLAFGQDGTLYVAHQPDASGYTVSSVAGTGAGTPGARTALARVPESDGIAVSRAGAATGGPAFLVVNRRDGKISRVDLDSGGRPVRDLLTGGSRGDFVAAGPDGCLYATQTSEVLRLTAADGSCVDAALEPTGVPIRPPVSAFIELRGGASTVQSCTSNRRLSVRFRAPAGIRITRARIFVRGKHARTVSGGALRRSVVVRRLPAGRFTLTIRAKTTGGRTIVVRRRYGACAGR
jgi:sugar lactone lactonase YvrE